MASLVKREAGTAAAAAASDDDDEERPPLPPPVALDLSECDRGVWLVKLPAFAAGRWREACAEGKGAELGRLVVEKGKAGKSGPDGDDDDAEDDDGDDGDGDTEKPAPRFPTLLRLSAAGARPGAPTVLSVRGDVAGARGHPPARVFAVSGGDGSREAGGGGAAAAVVVARASGRVSARLDAVVSAGAASAAASAAAASSYGALARERAAAARAAQEGRTLQVIDDPRPGALRRAAVAAAGGDSAAASAGGVSSALALKRAAAAALAAAPASSKRRPKKGEWEHRARAPKDQVEAALFRCFERQRHWTFAALHAETDQPAPWLREVLEGVAVLNKRGPLKGQWEQRKDFGE